MFFLNNPVPLTKNSALCSEKGLGKLVAQMESAEVALPTRGKQEVSRLSADGTYLFILLFPQVEILIST